VVPPAASSELPVSSGSFESPLPPAFSPTPQDGRSTSDTSTSRAIRLTRQGSCRPGLSRWLLLSSKRCLLAPRIFVALLPTTKRPRRLLDPRMRSSVFDYTDEGPKACVRGNRKPASKDPGEKLRYSSAPYRICTAPRFVVFVPVRPCCRSSSVAVHLQS
jgi:hypothetical protein